VKLFEDVQGSCLLGIFVLPPCAYSYHYHGLSGGVRYPSAVAFRALF
jgi:hypothetical protein